MADANRTSLRQEHISRVALRKRQSLVLQAVALATTWLASTRLEFAVVRAAATFFLGVVSSGTQRRQEPATQHLQCPAMLL